MERLSRTEISNTPSENKKTLPRSPLSGPVMVMFEDNVELDRPNSSQPWLPKETSAQRSDLELPQLVTSITPESNPQPPSSTSTYDAIEEHKTMATDALNPNTASLHSRFLQRLKRAYRVWTRHNRDRKDRSVSIPNRRSSSIGTIYQMARRFSSKTGSDQDMEAFSHFHQATRNCQQKYLVLHTLSKIAEDLLRQQQASLCQRRSTDGNSAKRAFVIGEDSGPTMEDDIPSDCIEGVRQMLRICSWSCGEIKDELRGLKLSMSCGGQEEKEAKKEFVTRWSHQPQVEYGNVNFCYGALSFFAESDVDVFVDGRIYSNLVGTVLPLWTGLREQWFHKSASVSRLPEAELYPKPKAKLLERIVNGLSEERHLKIQLAERCLDNLETLEELLHDLLDEVNQKIDPGRGCRHSRPCLPSACSLRLTQAKLQLTDAIKDVLTFKEQAKPLLFGGMSKSDWDLVKEYGSLPIPCARELIGATSEEQVERIVMWPPHEDKHPGLDPKEIAKLRSFRCTLPDLSG